MQSNVLTQQLQNISSLLQCLLKYVHFSPVLCPSRGVSQLRAVFEEGFTEHLQRRKHQPSRGSVKRLLNSTAAVGKKWEQNIRMTDQPPRNTSIETVVVTEYQVRGRATGWCQWRKHRDKYIFQREKKKRRGIIIRCKILKLDIPSSCWLFSLKLLNRIILMEKHSKDVKKTY